MAAHAFAHEWMRKSPLALSTSAASLLLLMAADPVLLLGKLCNLACAACNYHNQPCNPVL